MAIDPEIIPSSSSAGDSAVRHFPKWAVFSVIGVVVIALVGILKMLLPLILMSLVISLIWNKSRTNV